MRASHRGAFLSEGNARRARSDGCRGRGEGEEGGRARRGVRPSVPAVTPPRGRSVACGGGDRWGAVAAVQKGGAAAAARMRGTHLAGRGGVVLLGGGGRAPGRRLWSSPQSVPSARRCTEAFRPSLEP